MKYHIYASILALAIINCHAMKQGTIEEDIVEGNITEVSQLFYAIDQQNYSSGGITFTYPASLFTETPMAFATVNTISSHGTTQTYTAEISSNSATAATVVVYHVSNGGTVVEAGTDSVAVTLIAIGD